MTRKKRQVDFSKILIANRGEIALRIIRACRDLGIKSAAVFSEIDRKAQHVLLADEAYCIGKAPAVESYLNAEAIVETAVKCGANAIHPGYGFLAENAKFAELCERQGIIFIGPPPYAVKAMGSKTQARSMMADAGVPIVPGGEQIKDAGEALDIARKIGYPVLIKAAYGGGGKGMRIVPEEKALLGSLESASREAKSAFADGAVYLEKYLENPRHIEIQILADNYGHVVHLGERECSIQRRHQKVVEESPSAAITPSIRAAMGEAAVQAALACGYRNAGTVEFMFAQGKFYFLEMNTRLQVEHPVTELVYGIDLVKEQINIAQGARLRFKQKDLQPRGHAIECRIYSEDENFLPVTGKISEYIVPQGPGVRVDGGIAAGDMITVYYDPMIAKLLVWGEDRAAAIARMCRALSEYRIAGVKTTIPFCLIVMTHNAFRSGDYSTGFVSQYYTREMHTPPDDVLQAIAAAAALLHKEKQAQPAPAELLNGVQPSKVSAWLAAGRLENII